MSTEVNADLALMAELTDKLAMELVYGETGTDIGLLPINYLLNQLEEICQKNPPPPAIQIVLGSFRQCIERIFETTGLFSADSLAMLGQATTWLTSAWEACSRKEEMPPLPVYKRAEGTTESVSSASAAAAALPSVEGESPLVLNLAQDAELLREFVSESQEHLQNIELGVLVLEENPNSSETLASIFRAFHTFKGGSGLLNLTPVNRLAHELESLLDLARQQKLAINSKIINLILEGGDVLKQFTNEIDRQLSGQNNPGSMVIPYQGLIGRVRAAVATEPGQAPLASATKELVPNGGFFPIPLASAAAEPSAENGTPAGAAAKASPGASGPEPGARAPSTAAAVVKVATQKLDSLVDLVGEMVIAQSLVAQDETLKRLENERLTRNLAQLGRITNELQRTAMSLRMVPIRSTFQKMNRLVRDLAAKQGKSVELFLEGEETELDRTIVEQLNDPLVHMIRNAVDHGIEAPAARLERQKPAQGSIRLSAYHQGGNIVIEIKDDGGGLNRDRILAKAIEKGLINENESLTENEIFRLIFAPGFSTAVTVTDISGRGVGMDVVRRNIEQLRGKVEIRSVRGHGSTFTIFLPLTLAIIDGLMVSVGVHRYILPTLLVRESFRPTAAMLSTVHERGEMVNVRGRLVPLLRLYDYFGIAPQSKDPTQSIVVVVGSGHENRCLLVDQLLGKQEVVIKSLGETFKQNSALAGAAILGDGRVGLILDVDYLVRLRKDALKKAA